MNDQPTFSGLVLNKTEAGVIAAITSLQVSDLPPGEVLIRVQYSTLNYKDALAVTRGAPVVRRYPMVPGIDLAGVVAASDDARFEPGDRVLVNGWGLGENHWGGFAGRARVPGDFVQKIPEAFTALQSMAIGTAGYTAMLCVMALQRGGITPEAGPVLVTGASGGVGSVAVALLSAGGYDVVASTGKAAAHDDLHALGAGLVIERTTLSDPGKPLQEERWAGAIDCVGGQTLANVCASLRYRGVVAACGLAQGMDFPATVAPFILRGVTLCGIESVRAPRPERLTAWTRLAAELDPGKLARVTREISLADVPAAAVELLAGRVRGRIVVALPQ